MYKTNLIVSLNVKTITFPGIPCVKTTEYRGNNPSLNHLGFIYIRAKANAKVIFFFDVCRHCCHYSVNTQIGNNTTG